MASRANPTSTGRVKGSAVTGSRSKGGDGLSSSLLSSRLNASERRGEGRGGQERGGEALSRPQLVDATGRNVTPKPMSLGMNAAREGEKKTGTVLAAAAAAVRNRNLAASSASHTSDADSEDRMSSGFSQSGLSENEEDNDSGDENASETGVNESLDDHDDNFVRNTTTGPPIYHESDSDVLLEKASAAMMQGPFAALSILAPELFMHGFPSGLPAMQQNYATSATNNANNALGTAGLGLGGAVGSAAVTGKLPDAVLDALVSINLQETPTEIIFGMPAIRALQDSVESRETMAANERYDALCVSVAKSGVELFPSRGVSTLNAPSKAKEVMAVQPPVDSVEVQASPWEIDDVLKAFRDGIPPVTQSSGYDIAANAANANANVPSASIVADVTGAAVSAGIAIAPLLENHVETLVTVSLANPGCLLDVEGSVKILPTSSSSGQGAGAREVAPRMGINASTIGAGITSSTVGAPAKGAAVGLQTSAAVSASNNSLQQGQGLGSSNWGNDSVKSGSTGADLASSRGASTDLEEKDAKKQVLDTNAGAADLSSLDINTVRQVERILQSRNLIDSLALMERAVQQNLYHTAHRKYRARAGAELVEELLQAGKVGGHDAAVDVLMAAAHGRASSPVRARRAFGGIAEDGSDEENEDDERGGSSQSRSRMIERKRTADNAELEESADSLHRSHSEAGLQKLWAYWCPEVEGLTVSCMAWNKANRDLLAVGYGNIDYDSTSNDPAKAAAMAEAARSHSLGNTAGGAASKGGLIALWSISNPEHPQAFLKTPEGVSATALDFSTQHPSLLAAGLGDGTVCVFDVRCVLLGASDGSPGLTSNKLEAGAHTEAVWQVKWVTKADTGAEVLVSISTDGRATQWDCKKALAPTLLMTLKRARGLGPAPSAPAPAGPTAQNTLASTGDLASGTTTSALPAPAGADVLGLAAGTPMGDGILARTASGLTFDFSTLDNTMYFVGTEDGLLARCSTSYSEQYLEVIQAHSAPINKLRLSPFSPFALLTCSADWTVKLWNLSGGLAAVGGAPGSGSTGPSNCITYQVDAVQDAVADIVWSPIVATVFACVTRDGHIQLWEAGSLSPLVDTISTLDEELWQKRLAAQAAEKQQSEELAAAEARRKRRMELGYDDEDEAEEEKAVMDAIATGQRPEDRRGSMADMINPVNEEESAAQLTLEPVPRKRLTCVLFADTNTQILVTGDTTGRVDVYRIVGLDDIMDTTAAAGAGSSGGGVDALQSADDEAGDRPKAATQGPTANAGNGNGVGNGNGNGAVTGLAVGSEAYEAQVAALQAVLASMSA